MEEKIHKKKISNIIHRGTTYYNIKRCNSPIFLNNRIKNYLLVNEFKNRNLNKNKKTNELKSSKSTKDFNTNKIYIKNIFKQNKSQENNINKRKNINKKYPLVSNKNKKIINYIKKKVTFQPFSPIISKRSSNHNIIIKNYTNKNKIISSGNSLNNSNKKTNNNFNEKMYMSSKPSFSNKKKFFYSSKLSISLDKIIPKNINNLKKKKNAKSFDKSKFFGEKNKNLSKFSINKINNYNNKQNIVKTETKKLFNNKLKNSKINLEKKRKIYKYNKKKNGKVQCQNITEIVTELYKPNKVQVNNNTINEKNKNKNIIYKRNINKKLESLTNNNLSKNNKNCLNYSKENSDLISDDCYNILYDPKLLGENHSTNDKSLNNKKEGTTKKKIITPNILLNKHKNIDKNKININSLKEIDSDGFFTYEFDIGNEQINKINGVRTNNFDINKPKEENLKFTFMKGEKESDISCSHASKIVIGNIDGYKDIIETDIKNNENKLSKCFNNLINKKTNLFNNTNKLDVEGVEFSSTGGKKKFSNMSTLLKKESEPITFNDCILYDSFNMTNNLDNISSTISNNINNKKKGIINNINNKNNNTFKDFSHTSFIINTDNDKSIDNSLKCVNYSIIKGNNLENLTNNCNNKKIILNNGNVNRKSISNSQRKKNDDINTNCIII